MNNITVKTFDEKKLKELISSADPCLQQYIKSLKGVSDGWERLFKDAMKKIRENATNRYVIALEVLEEHKWDDDLVSPRQCFKNWLDKRINITR